MDNKMPIIYMNMILSAVCCVIGYCLRGSQQGNKSWYLLLAILVCLFIANSLVVIDYRLSISKYYTNAKNSYSKYALLTLPLLISVVFFIYGDQLVTEANQNYFQIMFEGLAITFACIGISIQIGESHKIQEANCILSLNKAFTESEEFAKTYTALEKEYYKPEEFKNSVKKSSNEDDGKEIGLSRVAISNYLTFFETIYLLYKNENISEIMLNDLFSYRFFLAAHSKYVQEEKLVSQPMNFRNIYYLEKLWIDYRKSRGLPIHNYENRLEIACDKNIYNEIMKHYKRNLRGGE